MRLSATRFLKCATRLVAGACLLQSVSRRRRFLGGGSLFVAVREKNISMQLSPQAIFFKRHFRVWRRSRYIFKTTKAASPRWADARLGSANARNYRGCRQIEAVNATVLPRGTLKMIRVLNDEERLESDSMNHINNFAIRHTMTNMSSKQQLLQQQRQQHSVCI